MRVVLDTNVLLAALMVRNGTPDRIYQAWRDGQFHLISCQEQLEELRRVSRYPKLRQRLPAHRVGTLVNQLRKFSLQGELPALQEETLLADPGDTFLLQLALAADADWLITGDHRAGLLALGNISRTRIATPSDFLATVPRLAACPKLQ